ncbi:MAG TPA: hypothetical protein VEU08_15015, partial [Vicinamibacterales bacterium]|nr:hypothetical protein [Vicinamibacterales bacterium]
MPASSGLARRAAWLCYFLAVGGSVWLFYELIRLWQALPGSVDEDIYRSDSTFVAVLTLLLLVIAEGLRRGFKWAMWLAAALASVLISPVMPFVVFCLAAGVFLVRRGVPWAIVLPSIFVLFLTPGAIWYASGKGGHMSFLLLWPFGLPW